MEVYWRNLKKDLNLTESLKAQKALKELFLTIKSSIQMLIYHQRKLGFWGRQRSAVSSLSWDQSQNHWHHRLKTLSRLVFTPMHNASVWGTNKRRNWKKTLKMSGGRRLIKVKLPTIKVWPWSSHSTYVRPDQRGSKTRKWGIKKGKAMIIAPTLSSRWAMITKKLRFLSKLKGI